MNRFISFLLLFFFILSLSAQKDQAVFKPYQVGFYHNVIMKEMGFKVPDLSDRKVFKATFDGVVIPNDTNKYERCVYLPPVHQGMTGTCWCYAATSFMEAEILRSYGKKVKLSEMYTVYWEYVDRAADYVKLRGNYFAEGSEASSIPVVWEKYGIVPVEAYPGKPATQPYHNHREMVEKMSAFLDSMKEANAWNEEVILKQIRKILDSYMGAPPAKFKYEGKDYTPQAFLKEVVKLNLNDYYNFMSTKSANYMERSELVEADNWRHYDKYYNLNCEDFTRTLVDALKKKYSVCICGDISEPGIDAFNEAAYIPSFDIPQDYINDDSRELRLQNGSTTDDHCMHAVGWYYDGKHYWFLFKDSNAGAYDGPNKGYRFFRDDFVKLKMMNLMIHKEGAPILDKIIK